jgi:queuine tRNA-ribosyltransferase subunit QTRTD1
VLGCRRTPPVAAPPATSNTNTSIAVLTSVGFKQLKAEEYADAVEGLGADIVLGLGDVPFGRALGSKRIQKATDRSIDWLKDHVARRRKNAQEVGFKGQAQLFAPLLPLSCANQQFYIDYLVEDVRNDITGLAIYSADTSQDLPDELVSLPRLDLTEPNTPLEVLRQISIGADIVTIPFISGITDAGIALDYTFPGPSATPSEPLPLGIDFWTASHATDLGPLREGCTCYACTDHHRAFLHHLLSAKEMLGWVLLQIHNHHVMDEFFAAIRRSIAAGTFEADVETFSRCYESELPEKTGQGPRYAKYYRTKSCRNDLFANILIGYEATNSALKALERRRRTLPHSVCTITVVSNFRWRQRPAKMLASWRARALPRSKIEVVHSMSRRIRRLLSLYNH